MAEKKSVADYIISIPDFPQKGVLFRDVTGILDSGDGFRLAENELMKKLEGVKFDAVAGVESRGFIFGAPLALQAGVPFIPVRKKGKLPRETISEDYALEYGTATLEMHTDAVKPGDRVVIVDDLIATGGTVGASARLVERLGGEVVKCLFLIELEGLNGRKNLAKYDVDSVVKYSGK